MKLLNLSQVKQPLPQAQQQLEELFNELIVASNLKVEIHGYTDNVGDANNNLVLSQARSH